MTGSRGSRANLTYSSVLDSSAANYAVELARLDNGLVHASNRNGQGENLYYTSNSDLKTPFQAASKAWLDEKPFYDCRNINGADPNFGKFGHYSKFFFFLFFLSWSMFFQDEMQIRKQEQGGK